MLTAKTFLKSSIATAAFALLIGSPLTAQEDHSQHDTGQKMDHSQMDHSQMDHSSMPGMEDGMHMLTPDQLKTLRSKIPLYQEYSDEEIMMGMSRMKNHGGTLSAEGVTGDVGVLALGHGGKANDTFLAAYNGIAQSFPTTYSFGMAMMGSDHIQSSIDSLEAAGAKKILLIPTTTADHSTLMQQWRYILDLEEESAYLDVPRVKSDADIIVGDTPTASPITSAILTEHAKELSSNPENTLVIIMAHGPQGDEDNAKENGILADHGAYVETLGGFADVKSRTVQDDAPKATRAANVATIRGWIADAEANGQEIVVVHTALTDSGVVGRMGKDVAGTTAKFNSKGLMEHSLFSGWIAGQVDKHL